MKCHWLRPLLRLPPRRPGSVGTCTRLPQRVPLSPPRSHSPDDERLATSIAGGPVFRPLLPLPSRSPPTPAVSSSDQLICLDTAQKRNSANPFVKLLELDPRLQKLKSYRSYISSRSYRCLRGYKSKMSYKSKKSYKS